MRRELVTLQNENGWELPMLPPAIEFEPIRPCRTGQPGRERLTLHILTYLPDAAGFALPVGGLVSVPQPTMNRLANKTRAINFFIAISFANCDFNP